MIVILEDDPRRCEEMKMVLSSIENGDNPTIFCNAPEMIEWLKENLKRVRILSLDHDLGPNIMKFGKSFDPGTGRDVVDFLKSQVPNFPIILHTSNNLARDGMEFELKNGGWQVFVVYPFNDLEWIQGQWINQIKEIIK